MYHLVVTHSINIRLATADQIIDLRHRVLRTGLPRTSAMFSNDALQDSFHVAAFDGALAVCCATFHPGQWDSEPAWQLRGMATDAQHRSRGLGRRVLGFAEDAVQSRPMGSGGIVRLLWANARLGAIGFYQSQGWAIVSPVFEVPTAGPHHKIVKRVGS